MLAQQAVVVSLRMPSKRGGFVSLALGLHCWVGHLVGLALGLHKS